MAIDFNTVIKNIVNETVLSVRLGMKTIAWMRRQELQRILGSIIFLVQLPSTPVFCDRRPFLVIRVVAFQTGAFELELA